MPLMLSLLALAAIESTPVALPAPVILPAPLRVGPDARVIESVPRVMPAAYSPLVPQP